ncbi:MAG: carbohydrate ABC transporter permease, partial [Clostridiales bacterium]|nr:carbohydrate ABC transporter permease [Clostridiales bacterium]
MTKETRRQISTVIRYTLLIAVGFIMVYPLIWMVGATFKTNSEIFTSAWFWPKNPVMDGYDNAFVDYGGKINLIKSMLN